jgi:archaellum component FlaC
MTIDERLEKLAERHEALTQTVELIAAMLRDLTRDVQQDSEYIRALAERHEALTQTVELVTADLQTLKALAQQDGENIRALARIAEIHERRLTGMEGGE